MKCPFCKSKNFHGVESDPQLVECDDCFRVFSISYLSGYSKGCSDRDAIEKDLLIACKYLMSFVPDWAKLVPKGLDSTFYGTLTYQGDLRVKRRVNSIKALIKKTDGRF